jgi:YVTN family beta-propeller protein/VCBS repeat-containing protein
VYVGNGSSGTVSVINPATNQVVGNAIPVGQYPQQIAVSSDGTRAYVTNYGTNNVSVINTATNTVDGNPIAVSSTPMGVALSADGSVLYVANGDATVSVFDTATRALIKTLQTDSQPDNYFHMIAVAADGSLAVTDYVDNALHIVHMQRGNTLTLTVAQPNPTTGVVTGKVSTDSNSGTVTYTPSTPSLGAVVMNADGTFNYTPTALGRQVARITAAIASDQFNVTVDDGSGTTQTVPVTVTIAPIADLTGVDATAALQTVFDRLKAGDSLTLAPGPYQYSNVLHVNTSGVQINGGGATLLSTNAAAAALQILASNVSLKNLNLTAPLGLARSDGTNQTRLVFGGTGNTVSDVNIVGGASVGIYIVGASNFEIDRVTVQGTAADGVQMTGGSNHGVLNNVTVGGTGDDAIAVVSYSTDAAPCTDIVINNPVVNGTLQARGLVVVGGERITFNNITVRDTSMSGVFVGSQGGFFGTRSTTDVKVNGGTITRANVTSFPFGSIMVLSQNPGQSVTNVTISGVTINTPSPGQTANIVVATAGNALTWQQTLTATPQGTMSNIVFQNIAIVESPELPVFFSNAPGTYTATGFTMNGRPITPPVV